MIRRPGETEKRLSDRPNFNSTAPRPSNTPPCQRDSRQPTSCLSYGVASMAPPGFMYCLLLCFVALPFSWALKFDLAAHTGSSSKYERCIRNFVAKETLVLVTAIVDGHKGDGQVVNMHVSLEGGICQGHTTNANAMALLQIKDAVGNEYGKPKDIVGETRMAFTSHADAAFDVCFENQLVSHREH